MAKPTLIYSPKMQFFDNDGQPLNGGKVFLYQTGTTTKLTTYTTAALSVSNTNPLILDSAGRNQTDVYSTSSYKMVVTASTDSDPPLSPIWTVDNVALLGQQVQTVSKTTNYTTVITDRDKLILADASSGNITITLLPSATAGDGFNIKVMKVDSSSNTVTIQANAAETINGSNTKVLNYKNEFMDMYNNATQWFGFQLTNTAQTFVDTNGNTILKFNTTASAVNYIALTDAATGNAPQIGGASTTDTNVSVILKGQGTGAVRLGQSTTTDVRLEADQPIADSSGNEYLKFSKTATAVNEHTITNAATGNPPIIQASGSDTNIYEVVRGKGNLGVKIGTPSGSIPCIWEPGSTTNTISHSVPTITAARTYTWPNTDIASHVVQQVRTLASSSSTGATVLPFDDTIPQSGEGTEFFSVDITPKTTTNRLVIEAVVHVASSVANNICAALFQDSITDALNCSFAITGAANEAVCLKIIHEMASGTTSTTRFKIRAGGSAAGTTTFNGTSGARKYGGVLTSTLVVTEYSA